MSEPLALTRLQVAAALSFKDPHSTDELVRRGVLPPPFYPFTRSPRWRRADVESAVAALAQAAQPQREAR